MRIEKLPRTKGKCYLFADRINRFYFSGTDIAEGYLLVFDTAVYFTDLRYFSAAKEKLGGTGITSRVLISTEDVADEIKSRETDTVYIDYSRTTLTEYEEYKKLFGGVKIADCSALVFSLMAVKDDAEIANVKAACSIAEKAVADAMRYAYTGITESELKKYLETRIEELGGEGAAFDTIVAFGKNAAVPHHETGDTRLKPDEEILIDTGAKVNGYLSDITRTAFFGTPDGEFLRAYGAVLSANEKAEREIVGGIGCMAADKIARDALDAAGYGRFFTHSLGHGVGLNIHEKPYLSPKSGETLAENAVFTVEPGVYLDGKFGIRIEDTCVIVKGKVKRLFSDDKSLMILKPKKKKTK